MKRNPRTLEAGMRRRLAGLLLSGIALAPNATVAQQADAPSMSIPLAGVLGATVAENGTTSSPAPGGGTIALPANLAVSAPPVRGAPAAPAPGPRVERAKAAAEPAPDAAAALPVASLWPLDWSLAADGAMTLRGESDSVELSLFVPPGPGARELAVAAVSSAFILPRRSVLRAYIGDRLLGEMPLRSITETEEARFAIPAEALVPGFNRVRVEVDLAHRLYCGDQAAYDLWTRLDLTRSGVSVAPEQIGEGAAAFLTAASVARGAGMPIVIRHSDGSAAAPEEMREISRQLDSVMGGGFRVAGRAPAATKAALPAPVVEIRSSGASGATFRTGPDGEQVLQVRVEDDVLPQIFSDTPVANSAATLPALPRDVAVPISRLGFSTLRIADHLWRQDLGFRLPADWLINVKERAALHLDFAYLSGMPDGSELRVRVNGHVVRLIPLERGGRLDELPLEVRFDAGLLRAGRNLIALEVAVPGDPADQPCLAASDGRIEIRDTTTLTVPPSSRMHMPGIGRWMSSASPLGITFAASGAPDGNFAHFALDSGLITALGGEEELADGQTRRLVVLRQGDLSRAAFGQFGIGRQVMVAALQAPVKPEDEREPVAFAPPKSASPQEDPLAAMAPLQVAEASMLGGAVDHVRSLALRLQHGIQSMLFPDPIEDLAAWLGGQSGQALLFQLDEETPDDLYLLISEDAQPAAVATALGAAAQRGVPLDGHLALLSWDGVWTTWTDRTRLPVLEDRLSENNWRGVIGNFASARPRIFVGVLVAIALISVLLANSYINASRRQR
jgi:cellulose synthase operon protein B